MEIMHACIPRVAAKFKKTLPWINRHILQLIAKRNSCYRCLKNIADDCRDADLLKYIVKSLRNRVVGLIREEKRRYFENINSLDQKVFWKAGRMLNNTTSSIPTLVSHCDGSHATTSN